VKIFLNLLFNTSKGLNLLDEKYEDDLYRKSIFLFIVLGVVSYLSGFDLMEESRFLKGIFILFVVTILYVFLGLIYSFILLKIGRLLKGKATYTEVCSLFSYSLMPFVLSLVLIWIMNNAHHFFYENRLNIPVLKKLILVISSLLSVKILLQGLIKFNNYSLLKGSVNVLFYVAFVAYLCYKLVVFI